MVGNVGNILSAVQSAQLSALKRTSLDLDVTSAHLASGLDVNSALDNPGNFFIARALRNKAADLTRLLDGISQNIRVIQEADHGIKAGLDILDLAESYLLDMKKKWELGEIEYETVPDPTAPVNDFPVTFTGAGDFIPYDAGQDSGGTANITVNGAQVTLAGNYWKRKAFTYTITANTYLVFDYSSTVLPEISSIGFDNDTNFGNDSNRFFINGSQTGGITYAAPIATYRYSGAGAVEQYAIPIGTYFTGTFNYITFINDDDAGPSGDAIFNNISLREGPTVNVGTKTQVLASYSEGYQKIVGQLDQLTRDAHYRGTNLLGGETMTTYFNESRTHSLTSEGIDATYSGLGLETFDFNSLEAVNAKIEQVRLARNELRQYSSTLANDLSVLQIRQDLTLGQINIREEGADDLTVADQNEEGAKMLALQTRQQMQINTLALSSQANILTILS